MNSTFQSIKDHFEPLGVQVELVNSPVFLSLSGACFVIQTKKLTKPVIQDFEEVFKNTGFPKIIWLYQCIGDRVRYYFEYET